MTVDRLSVEGSCSSQFPKNVFKHRGLLKVISQMFTKAKRKVQFPSPISVPQMSYQAKFHSRRRRRRRRSINVDNYHLTLSTTDECWSWCLTGWQSHKEISWGGRRHPCQSCEWPPSKLTLFWNKNKRNNLWIFLWRWILEDVSMTFWPETMLKFPFEFW